MPFLFLFVSISNLNALFRNANLQFKFVNLTLRFNQDNNENGNASSRTKEEVTPNKNLIPIYFLNFKLETLSNCRFNGFICAKKRGKFLLSIGSELGNLSFKAST